MKITLSQYLKLAEACDWILVREESAVSIPFLHVKKEHPELLKDYEDVFEVISPSGLGDFFASSAKAFWAFAKICVSAVLRGFSDTLNTDALPDVDVIIVSHLVSLEQAANGTDLYFGELAQLLKQDFGLKVLTLWLSHLPQHVTYISEPDPDLTHAVVPRSLNLLLELKFLIEVLILWLRLGRLKPTSELQRKVLSVAANRALSPDTIHSLRQKYIFRKVIAQTDAKCVAFTWEGHAYERLLVSAVHSSGSRIEPIAYMHAPVTEFQHAAFRALSEKYDPKNFFVRGIGAAERLTLSYPRATVRSIVISNGNPRQMNRNTDDYVRDMSILVLPEGFINETLFMIKFALQCAELNPQFRFVIRTHPAIDNAKLFVGASVRTWPHSVTISSNSLKDDAKASQYALFRGSSAIFEAACYGCQPVYVERNESLYISPLYSIKKMIPSVSEPHELSGLLRKAYHRPGFVLSKGQELFGRPNWATSAKALAEFI